jgi:hypothetical protein
VRRARFHVQVLPGGAPIDSARSCTVVVVDAGPGYQFLEVRPYRRRGDPARMTLEAVARIVCLQDAREKVAAAKAARRKGRGLR